MEKTTTQKATQKTKTYTVFLSTGQSFDVVAEKLKITKSEKGTDNLEFVKAKNEFRLTQLAKIVAIVEKV